MKLTLGQLHRKLKDLDILSSEGVLIKFSQFKNRASVHKYVGRGVKTQIVFVGEPKKSLFAFYIMYGRELDGLKEAYSMLSWLAKGDMEDYENESIQWGNRGIPISYGDLRTFPE